MKPDFSEIGHTGGKVTFVIESDSTGHVRYAIRWTHSRPQPATLCGVYVHPDGFPCANIVMGGIGQSWSAPPFSSCIAVLMASDSEGNFGHECPTCHKHFRTNSIPALFPLTCPYCALRKESFQFLTPPQMAYIEHYVQQLSEGVERAAPNTSTEIVIDMDAVADAITTKPRSDFYPASVSQQTQFRCAKCGAFNDVRGRYCYCADCGWRNNAASLDAALARIRDSLNADTITAAEAVKQAVSEFDSAARNIIDELERRVPMKATLRKELQELLCHNLDLTEKTLRTVFRIELLAKMTADREFIRKMFLRRHVYEHDGGVATTRYVRDSGDTTVQEGDLIRESKEDAHKLISSINRMMGNLDNDFHELFPQHEYGRKETESHARRQATRVR